jgi:hypothetical protein
MYKRKNTSTVRTDTGTYCTNIKLHWVKYILEHYNSLTLLPGGSIKSSFPPVQKPVQIGATTMQRTLGKARIRSVE